ncbi:MAG TPA: hypothetical protein VGX25_03905 [Actinophytocola sp.]|uniref:hypothetical protein n=1 Tax=Actinophytocola sp. TaxID=1872138 RepID=UPI002DDD0542|nr:hypothetical protein [Actinophytocola sp.]HEV2778522.1 hypothetical protein [Actinophytocola sp.]
MSPTTTPASRNGHVPGHRLDPGDHQAALAGCRTLADKVRYACEHNPGATTEMIREWLDGHGVPTRNAQRPYVSTTVNAWRAETGQASAAPAAPNLVQTAPKLGDSSAPSSPPAAEPDTSTEHHQRVADVSTEHHERVRPASGDVRSTPDGAFGFYLVALLSLAVSVDTSWRFFGAELGITNLPERVVMFTVLEAGFIACGYGMRAGVRRTGRPGPARFWVWALCGLAGYMALVLSGPVAGIARVALGPGLGLVMLHLALGIEIRARAHRAGTWARVGRELRERLLSRLGLADDERDALARTRDRAARRVAQLSLGRFVPWRASRLARAVRASNVAHDAGARARMLAELAAVRHAGELATLNQPSPWTEGRTQVRP